MTRNIRLWQQRQGRRLLACEHGCKQCRHQNIFRDWLCRGFMRVDMPSTCLLDLRDAYNAFEWETINVDFTVYKKTSQSEHSSTLRSVLFIMYLMSACLVQRFLFLLLGPHGKGPQYHEIGRSMATLMTDEVREGKGDPLCNLFQLFQHVLKLY